MRIIIQAAGTAPGADVPYRMRARVEDGGTHHVELRDRAWTCTCGGGCNHIAAVKPLAGQEPPPPSIACKARHAADDQAAEQATLHAALAEDAGRDW